MSSYDKPIPPDLREASQMLTAEQREFLNKEGFEILQETPYALYVAIVSEEAELEQLEKINKPVIVFSPFFHEMNMATVEQIAPKTLNEAIDMVIKNSHPDKYKQALENYGAVKIKRFAYGSEEHLRGGYYPANIPKGIESKLISTNYPFSIENVYAKRQPQAANSEAFATMHVKNIPNEILGDREIWWALDSIAQHSGFQRSDSHSSAPWTKEKWMNFILDNAMAREMSDFLIKKKLFNSDSEIASRLVEFADNWWPEEHIKLQACIEKTVQFLESLKTPQKA